MKAFIEYIYQLSNKVSPTKFHFRLLLRGQTIGKSFFPTYYIKCIYEEPRNLCVLVMYQRIRNQESFLNHITDKFLWRFV